MNTKVKESLYRPGQALRVPGGWGFQISRQSAHEGDKVVSPMHWPPIPPRKYSWYLFLLEAELTIVWPEGWSQWKIPMTPSGIEPATFRLVLQCLNQLSHHILPIWTQAQCYFQTPSRWSFFKRKLHTNRNVIKLSKSKIHAQRQHPVLTTCSMDQ
jgi:hypothetical protein